MECLRGVNRSNSIYHGAMYRLKRYMPFSLVFLVDRSSENLTFIRYIFLMTCLTLAFRAAAMISSAMIASVALAICLCNFLKTRVCLAFMPIGRTGMNPNFSRIATMSAEKSFAACSLSSIMSRYPSWIL